MALNWSKALQVGGRSVRESGMLMGGMMLDIEKLREPRLEAGKVRAEEREFQTAAAGLTQAQKAYKAVFDNDYSTFKMLEDEWAEAPVGGDLALGAEEVAAWRVELKARLDEAWDTAENSKADFFRASGIDYKKQPDPPALTDSGLIQGMELNSLIETGMANFKDKEKLVGKLRKKLEAGEMLNLDKSMRDVQDAIINWNQAQSLEAGRGKLSDEDKEALALTRDEAASVRKGIREALRKWEAEAVTVDPEPTGMISQVDDGTPYYGRGVSVIGNLLASGHVTGPPVDGPVGRSQMLDQSRSTDDIEGAAVERYVSQLSPQAQQFWQKYIQAQEAQGATQALALLGEEFQALSQADKKIIARLQPDLLK